MLRFTFFCFVVLLKKILETKFMSNFDQKDSVQKFNIKLRRGFD